METCVVVVLPLQLPVASLAPRVVVAPPPTVSVDLYLSRFLVPLGWCGRVFP